MHIHRWGSIRFVERTHELMFRCGIEKDPQRRYIQKFHRRWSVLVVYIYIYILLCSVLCFLSFASHTNSIGGKKRYGWRTHPRKQRHRAVCCFSLTSCACVRLGFLPFHYLHSLKMALCANILNGHCYPIENIYFLFVSCFVQIIWAHCGRQAKQQPQKISIRVAYVPLTINDVCRNS